MTSTIETVESTVILTASHSALDAETASEFREDFNAATDGGCNLLLDLSNVEFVDSAGLGSIVASLKQLRAAGGEMKICSVAKPVRALFELVRMHKLVDIYSDRAEALA